MPVFTEAELQQHYREANIDFAVRTTVFLAAANDLARALSGVLLQTMEGVPFLVTACHMAHDDEWRPVEWRPLRMFVPALKRELRDVGDRVSFAPLAPGRSADKPVDVAVVRLRADLHDLLRPLAAPIEVVGDDDRIDPAADVVLLTGFPSYLAFQSLTDPRLILLSTMTHFTGITGHDDLTKATEGGLGRCHSIRGPSALSTPRREGR